MSNDIKKLSDTDKSLLQLYARSERDADGWANCSKPIYTWLSTFVRTDLVELEPIGEVGRMRLTSLGNDLLNAMAYL